jgi:hypothetical protein
MHFNSLRNYLHLYLGCEGELTAPDGIPYLKTEKLNTWLLNEISEKRKSFKPILRPLSDLTEEEMDYVVENHGLVNRGQSPDIFVIGWRSFQPETFMYLLKQGFDLFGLIEAGLAIDKTKHHAL